MPARTKSHSDSAKAVDRQLERYRSMRDFHITAEPRGGANNKSRAKKEEPMPFVIQKHAATRLHYDFRLGWRGVLKSWAVTKGPSYFTGDKRLAVQVEDHPMEYGGFEGTIPKGQYGGGTVMVWDFGKWKAEGDVDQELEKGNLKFWLEGTKMRGKWALIRLRPRPNERSDKPNWLLIKEKDEWAQPEDAPAITEEAPDSALTQRTMEQIAKSSDHVWDSKVGLRENPEPGKRPSGTRERKAAGRRKSKIERTLRSIPKEKFPGFVAPQLAQQARSAPTTDDWVHELKLDGYRVQIQVRRDGARHETKLLTRNGLDWTARMPELAQAAATLDVDSAILDGEVVVLDSHGRANFGDLQASFQKKADRHLLYFAFDVLHLNGHNLRELSLLRRKEILTDVLSGIDPVSPLRMCEHIEAPGDQVLKSACKLGAEGIVSKVASARYTSGRSVAWLKMKCGLQQEFVVGGFTPPSNGGRGLGALLLGYYDEGKLRYAGRVGTGFKHETERALRIRLDALVQKRAPFAELPRESTRGVFWVKPELVAQVSFTAWTNDNLVRQAAFKHLREDKSPEEVVREFPAASGAEPEESPASSPQQRAAPRSRTVKTSTENMPRLPITHPDKVLDHDSGMTKQQLAEYYYTVAEEMLPHIANRPLSVVRCPDGVGSPCFFQKHVSRGLPRGVNNIPIANKKTGKKEEFLTVSTQEGLVGLAQLGALEIHPWGSTNDSIDQPDRIIFDLDPDESIAWSDLAGAAEEMRKRLAEFKLTSFLKSTGGKGLHVVAPIRPEHDWATVKQFAHAVALKMEKENPRLYITNMSKAARKNKIYLDYLRNDRESTAIAPFSTRARPGVPISMTLEWKELKSKVAPKFYVTEPEDWRKRLRRDPWAAMADSEQRLTAEALRAAGVKA
ncbi:MAG TPA: DNA ligase D [Terracidiphilus sp.]|nr:DNA ligase D [Terracidiphilus sp.]